VPPTPPFWFKQRQGKIEPVEGDLYRLTAPNLAEAFIALRPAGEGRYQPVLRLAREGPDVATGSHALECPEDAWEAAFELYRNYLVV